MPEDIARLRSCFPGRSVTLVAGCDVVCGASAYRSLRPGGVQELDHLLIRRGETDETDIRTRLQGRVTFLELPPQLEGISSTRIRESIDQDVDISMLVDPIVQSYIYEYDLYLRSPQHKNVLQAQELEFRITSMMQLSELQEAVKEVHVQLAVEEITRDLIARMGRSVKEAKGNTLLRLNVYDRQAQVSLNLFSKSYKVSLTQGLVSFFEDNDIKYTVI